MDAVVSMVNSGKRLAAVKTDGEYTIFKIMGVFSAEIGDVIRHRDFTKLGMQLYENLSKKQVLSVRVENVCRTFEQARNFLN